MPKSCLSGVTNKCPVQLCLCATSPVVWRAHAVNLDMHVGS